MSIKEFSWENPAGRSIYGVHWLHPAPKAAILLVHGLGEHCCRYEHVAQFFHQRAVALTGFDLPGFGQTAGRRGYAQGLDEMLDTIAQAQERLEAQYPGIPVFLYGHSMGGNLVLNYLLRRQPELMGLIASGPWIRLPKPPPGWLLAVAGLIKRVFPYFDQDNGLQAAYLSRDEAVVTAYQRDPLVHRRISAQLALEMVEAAAWLDRFAGEMPVPTLLLHGAEDRITSPAGTRDFAARVSGSVELELFPKLFHEIHNEPEKEQVLQRMADWLERQLAAGEPPAEPKDAPRNARAFILGLPDRIDPGRIAGVQTVFHFDLDGPGGGQFTLQVDDGKAEVLEGLQGTPRCTVSGKDEDVMALVDGNVNPLMAILSGKIKISDPGELLKYAKVFGLM